MTNRGHRLRTLADLSDTHIGRRVDVAGLTGVLTGVVPVGSTVQLALVVGGARVFTDALPADTHIEIRQKETP